MKSIVMIGLLAGALAAGASARASNLVTNGGFEAGAPGQLIPAGGTNNDPALSTTVPGWDAPITGINNGAPFLFVVGAGTADTTGWPDSWDYGNRTIWGTNNGGASPIPISSNPAGGQFLLLDADYNISPIFQLIDASKLNVGSKYTVSFYWAAAQWHQNDGPTTESLKVGLGGESVNTVPVDSNGVSSLELPSHGFSGWMPFSHTFTYGGVPTDVTYALNEGGATYSAAANALVFVAQGTPQGLPPTVLLDGVSLTAVGGVPEPATWAMMILGIGGIGAMARRRRATGLSIAAV